MPKIHQLIDKIFDFFLPEFIFSRIINYYHRRIARSILSRLKYHGRNTMFHRGISIHNAENLMIGHDVALGDRVTILAFGGVKIGNRVMIGHDTSILTATHNHTSRIMINEILFSAIEIGDDVWIGAKAIIMPGVTIGNGVVIGAGSIVTHSIPSNVIAFGAPARIFAHDRFSHPLKAGMQSFKYQYSTTNFNNSGAAD